MSIRMVRKWNIRDIKCCQRCRTSLSVLNWMLSAKDLKEPSLAPWALQVPHTNFIDKGPKAVNCVSSLISALFFASDLYIGARRREG